MNILLLSDTHGETVRAIEVFLTLKENGIKLDYIVHCGDFVEDADEIREFAKVKIISVPGNCDGCRGEVFEIIDTPKGDLVAIHGHANNVKLSPKSLLELASRTSAKIICFGHTHVAYHEVIDGVHLINPGSISKPRDSSKGSCALLKINDEIEVEFIRY